jgi:type I restriction enzyme, S subunit
MLRARKRPAVEDFGCIEGAGLVAADVAGSGESPLGPLPGGWGLARLGTITAKIGSGATPTGGTDSYLKHRDRFALVRSQNVFDHRFDADGLAFISGSQAESLRSAEIRPDDILLNITGDGITFGRACMAPADQLPACVNQHVTIIRVDPAKCTAGYLLGYLSLPRVKEYIESFNAGGSRRAVTKGHISSFVVPLAPLHEQQKIAEVVLAINDKIEQNRRTGRKLEALARAVFKAWFVDFEPVKAKAAGATAFPGMPAATFASLPAHFVDSELGPVPEGWRVRRLEDVLRLHYGKALNKTNRQPGEIPVYGSGGITGTHNVALVSAPGIIVGRKGSVGTLYWENQGFFPIDTTFYVEPVAGLGLHYLFELLQTLGLETMNTDAAVPGLNRENAYRLEVVVPPSDVSHRFDEYAKSLRDFVSQAARESAKLAALRDYLLPRLLSGRVRVRVGEAAGIAEAV